MFLVRPVFCLVLLLLALPSFNTHAWFRPTITTNSPGMVRLGWKPSPSANVAGYFLCWGLVSGQCTNRLDAGSVTNASLTGLISGTTYYFTVVAYSSFGDEAPPSNEVSYSLPTTTPNQPPTIDPFSDLIIGENSGPQTILITGLGPGSSNETQSVTVSVTSSKPSLISPVVHLGSPSTPATLTFVLAADAIGTATITVVANDGQATNNLTTRTFNVTVVRDSVTRTPFANVTIAPYSTFSCPLPCPFSNAHKVNCTLEAGAPKGATVALRQNTTMLTWVPTSAHASTTNLLSVRMTDSTDPTLTTNFLFVVRVLDYLAVQPGMIAVEAGQEAGLPLSIVSSEPLSDLTFNLSWPTDKFGIPSLTLANGSVFTGFLEVRDTNVLINLRATAGRSFVGSNLVATLNFTASSNQPSAFVPLRSTVLAGTKPDNGPFVGLFPGLGEAAIVADQPLLKALAPADSERRLNVYGRVGATYRVLYTTNSLADPVWQPLTTCTQTNVVQSLPVGSSDPVIFYRLEQQPVRPQYSTLVVPESALP